MSNISIKLKNTFPKVLSYKFPFFIFIWRTPHRSSVKNFINTLYISTNESYNKKKWQNHFTQQCVKFNYTNQWQNAAQHKNVYRCENQCKLSPSPVWLRGLQRFVWHLRLLGIIMDCLFYITQDVRDISAAMEYLTQRRGNNKMMEKDYKSMVVTDFYSSTDINTISIIKFKQMDLVGYNEDENWAQRSSGKTWG